MSETPRQRWPVPKSVKAQVLENPLIHPILRNPLHSFLVVLGLFVIVMSTQARAFDQAVPFSAALSPSEVWLQPGSELPGTVTVYFHGSMSSNANVWFDVQTPLGITIAGQLSKISTPLSFTRNWTVKAASDMPMGTYHSTITVHALVDGTHSVQTLPLTVTIGPKSHFTYQTSNVSTLAPVISNVQFSKNTLMLHRTESDSFSVSFTNHGSPTDYLFRLVEPTIGISTSITNATHRFVSPGETITAFFNVQTTSTSPFGETPIRIEAYNLATGERTFLGTVEVNVVEVTNLVASLPFHEYQISQNETFSTFITLQNTEWNDVDVIIASSSSQVQVAQHQVHVPSKSSVSVPVQLNASTGLGTIDETIYVTNAKFTTSVPLSIRTNPPKVMPVELETREMSFKVENDDAQDWQDVSFIVTQKPKNWEIGFAETHFALPVQESKTVALTISAPKGEDGSFTIQIFNEGVLVQTKTVESNHPPGFLSNATGFVTQNASSVIGLIVLIVALLLIFSKSIRNRIRASLPQPAGDVIHREGSSKR